MLTDTHVQYKLHFDTLNEHARYERGVLIDAKHRDWVFEKCCNSETEPTPDELKFYLNAYRRTLEPLAIDPRAPQLSPSLADKEDLISHIERYYKLLQDIDPRFQGLYDHYP